MLFLLNKFFKLEENHTNVKTEFLAGLTTFITMAYTMILNPQILKATGMDESSTMVACILVSVIGTLVMAFFAKLPLAVAPGLGLDAFFAYTICGIMGYSWQEALTVVFFEGVIFILMTLCNIREAFLDAIPENMKKAMPIGIGLFITLIGLYNCGLVVNASPIRMTDKFTNANLLSLFGILLIGTLLHYKVKGGILVGILVTTLVGIPLGVTVVPEHFVPVSMPKSMSATFLKLDFSWLDSFEDVRNFLFLLFTLLLVNIFDTLGILVGVVRKTNLLDENGKIPHVKAAFLADAVGTTCAGLFGTSVVTAYVESAAGVSEGGRTGLTALVTACFFFLCLFIAPVFLLVPMAAVAPAMVIIGLFMVADIAAVNFKEYDEAIPAFLTIVMMPFSYSIADGVILGVLSYVLLKMCANKFKEIPIVTYIMAIFFTLKLFYN